ncbi:MAG: hypothetical protein ABJN22_12075 [Litorimonas sp.]
MVVYILASEVELEVSELAFVIKFAFVISIFVLIGFANFLYFYYPGGLRLRGKDMFTVFLRKNWFWVFPLASFGVGLLMAFYIVETVPISGQGT